MSELFNIGNAGSFGAGVVAATNEYPPKGGTPNGGTPNAAGGGAPLQIIVGAKKPAEVYSYIRGITPENISHLLESFNRGYYREAIPAWRKMRPRDGHLLSVSEKRLGRVSALEWKILPNDESAAAERQAAYLKDLIEGIPEFEDRMEHLAEAIAHKVAGCEIEWTPRSLEGGRLGARLWPMNPEDFDATALETRELGAAGAAGRMRIYLGSGGMGSVGGVGGTPVELPPSKFVIHRLKVALMEPASILYVMKMISAGQWLAFGEKFGMPGIMGTAPASASEADLAKFYEMLCNWSQEFVAACREGYSVTPLTMSGANGPLTYPQLIDWADRENSKIWTGHTVTSEGQSGTGTLAGGAAQEQLDDLVLTDGARLARTIDRDLCAAAVRFQFGEPLLAHFSLGAEKPMTPADKKIEAETDAILINEVGLKLPKRDLHKKYSWREAEDGEDVVAGCPQVPPMGGGAAETGAETGAVEGVAGTGQEIQTTQATVLNGAQVTAATAIVTAVAARQIPRDSGIAQLRVLFNLSDEQAQQLMGTAGTSAFVPASQEALATETEGGGKLPTAFKAALATVDQQAANVAAVRGELAQSLQPLADLVARSGDLGREEFEAQLAALTLPVEGTAGALQEMLLAAHAAGRGQALTKAGGAE